VMSSRSRVVGLKRTDQPTEQASWDTQASHSWFF
jgi:hypothetical protein